MDILATLYKEEQILIQRIGNSESKEEQDALKRIVGRLNEEMKALES